MLAWVGRFGLFGLGNPGGGVWMFILSMIIYGVAFDFFNISGSLFVNEQTDVEIRSSAQGLFMMMTNGIGATIGTLGAQAVVNRFVYNGSQGVEMIAGWQTSWLIFAAYALVVTILFAIFFRYKSYKSWGSWISLTAVSRIATREIPIYYSKITIGPTAVIPVKDS